jgi:hypothetical protein
MIEKVHVVKQYCSSQLKELSNSQPKVHFTQMEALLTSKIKSAEKRIEKFKALAERYAF